MRATRCLVLSAALAGCGDNLAIDPPATAPDAPAVNVTCDDVDLAAGLLRLPGVTAATEVDCGDYVLGAARCFAIDFDQPLHHADAASKRFTQRLLLAHRGCARPMLVGDWGYSQDYFFDDELSVRFQTNTLWIEHRYQGESVPAPADWDWTALTIENGATDMHRIIESFRALYTAHWVSTGASKGGITATYHRYFFPDDVDGSIPYVAPASRTPNDPRYQLRLATALPQPCASQIHDAQVAALTTRRTAMLQQLSQTVPGAEALYLDAMIARFDWAFWQYRGERFCTQVPTAATPDAAFFDFFWTLSGFGGDALSPPGDERSNGALMYEWSTEQGFASQINVEILPLLVDPSSRQTMADSFRDQYPSIELPAFDGQVTAATRKWARDRAENLLLIYGQYDPWSGGALDEPTRSTSARFFVPAATHGAQISALSADDEAAAIAHASRMFGVPALANKPDARRAADHRQEILARHELRLVSGAVIPIR
ncbi:MAG TPA: S28 family serine protease [Kofleriaceae bacterium]|nr:S28 family serine protease [Kofleriaceae bacterium]